jgi:hypothetical protein
MINKFADPHNFGFRIWKFYWFFSEISQKVEELSIKYFRLDINVLPPDFIQLFHAYHHLWTHELSPSFRHKQLSSFPSSMKLQCFSSLPIFISLLSIFVELSTLYVSSLISPDGSISLFIVLSSYRETDTSFPFPLSHKKRSHGCVTQCNEDVTIELLICFFFFFSFLWRCCGDRPHKPCNRIELWTITVSGNWKCFLY